MASYDGQVFDFSSRMGPGPLEVGPNEFTKCTFVGTSVRSELVDPVRLVGQHVRNATVRGCAITGAVLEECVLDGLKVKNMPIIAGCVFRHVTLRGRINKLVIHNERLYINHPELAARDSQLLAQYYEGIDWALDISELDSPDFSIRGIPARLVRRDPVTQPVLDFETARSVDWSEVDMDGTDFAADVTLLLSRRGGDAILVASKTGPRAAREREVLDQLRADGLVS